MSLRRKFAKTVRNDAVAIIAGLSMMGGIPYAANSWVNHDLNSAPAVKTPATEQYRERLVEVQEKIDHIKDLRKKTETEEYQDMPEGDKLAFDTNLENEVESYKTAVEDLSLDMISDPQVNERTYKLFTQFRHQDDYTNVSVNYDFEENNADSINECRAEYLNSPAGTNRQIAQAIYTCTEGNDGSSFFMTLLGIGLAFGTCFAGCAVIDSKTVRGWESYSRPKVSLD